MKAKILLLIPVMLIFTAFTVVAQNASQLRHSVKDIIPFGQKLPPPDLTKYQGKQAAGMTNRGINTALTKGMNIPDANTIIKDPESYRQQLLNTRKLQQLSLSSNAAAPATNDRSERSANPDFHLTRDINALAESNPTNNKFGIPAADSYAILNNVIYFAADDGIHGNELWRSDGTAEGTFMVKDIEPGPGAAFIIYITAANGKLYFSAANAAYGLEPWVSDGTESGTQLLIDLQPGAIWGYPREFVAVGNDVFFIADGSNIYWDAIWKTDGTTEGTVLVKDIGAAGGGIDIVGAMASNGLLFFTMFDFNYGYELWRSDGTDAGTYLIKDIGPFEYSSNPTQLTNYNGKLYFSADDGTGRKLWITDGTDAGTDYAPGNNDILIDADYYGLKFPLLNNVLYIPGSSLATGNGLYKYDAAGTAGLVLVKDLTTGTEPAIIVASEMVIVNNRLYFKVFNSNDGPHDELWVSRGRGFNTWPVKKFQTGETASLLSNGNGTLYFVKNDAEHGSELWKTIGAFFGTTLVSDIFKGPTGSYPSFLTAFRGKLFFTAADEVKGNELFMTEGIYKGTALVKDINTSATSASSPVSLAALGHSVLFNAYERVHGFELYKSNGTARGTELVNDIAPGEASSFAGYASVSKNNAVYFITLVNNNYSIYKTNGRKNGLLKISPDFSAFQYFILAYNVADNGIVFYSIYNYYADTYELWRSDGTDKGNYLLSSTLYYYDYLNVAGNTAFFVAGDEVNGYELWKSDGSPEGTVIVKDINQGPGDAAPGGMFAFKNEVYFGAYDGISGYYSLWKSDGTEAGTIKLREIDPIWGYDANNTAQFFGISKNILYFSAIDYSDLKGNVLWKTDGSVSGTKPVKDINPNSSDPFPAPYNLTDVNGTVFFIADDGEHGEELWKTKGRGRNTKLVKDITPGIDPTGMNNLRSFADKLFFAKFTDNALFLWSSDGTEKGTKVVDDAGISNVEISSIISTGKKLFVAGYTYRYGSELYAGKVEDHKETFARAAASDQPAIKETSSFDAKLYPNPVSTKTSLQISGGGKNVTITITDVSGKKLWQSANSNASLVNLPTEKLAPGIYLVTVTNGKETKIIKLVKQ